MSKEVRANPVSSAAEAGNVSIMGGQWNRAFLDEVALFPNGANDDQVDAMTGAVSYLSSKKARIIV